MDPLQHQKSAMRRIWALWVDKCVSPVTLCFKTCDSWWLSDKIPQELCFLSRRSKLPLSYSCPCHPKVPAEVPRSPRPLLPPPNSHQAASEGHRGTGSLSFSIQSRKDFALPFYQEKCCSAAGHFFELGCVPNFSISLWMWRLGDQALNSCLLSLVPFPRLTTFLHHGAISVARGLSI